MEAETPLREVEFDEAQLPLVRGYQFLTLAPQLLVVNTESEGERRGRLGRGRRCRRLAGDRHVVAFPFPDALEVARLSAEEQAGVRGRSGSSRAGGRGGGAGGFRPVGLISFLTSGTDEVRAWPIRAGETAREAAGAIHSDIQRGFIRAEMVSYDDFMSHGANMKACRDAGVLRVEGKDYIVADGDIVNFRFNV